MRFLPWALWYAMILHTVWGVGILIGGRAAVMSTPAHAVSVLFPNSRLLAFILFGASVLAAVALGVGEPVENRVVWGLLLGPQAALMLVSGFGGIQAAWAHQYADGTVRPFWFIFTDQAPIIVGAFVHSCSVVNYFGSGLRWRA